MTKKVFNHVQVQLKEIIKISNIMNSGLSDKLQLKMRKNVTKRGREIIKTLEKNNFSSTWLEENFQLSVDELETIIKEL